MDSRAYQPSPAASASIGACWVEVPLEYRLPGGLVVGGGWR